MEETQYRAELEQELDKFDVYRVNAPWDCSLKALRSLQPKPIKDPISARDLAYGRIKAGRDSSLCTNGSYILQSGVYRPNKQLLVLSKSSLLSKTNSQKATQFHGCNKEFSLTAKQTEKYSGQAEEDKDKDPKEKRVLIVNQETNFSIPTNRFDEDELTLFLFKDQAKNYGDFLNGECRITEMPVWLVNRNYVNQQKNAFERQLWLAISVAGLGLPLTTGDLDYSNRVRGVLEKTGEASRVRENESVLQKQDFLIQKKCLEILTETLLK